MHVTLGEPELVRVRHGGRWYGGYLLAWRHEEDRWLALVRYDPAPAQSRTAWVDQVDLDHARDTPWFPATFAGHQPRG